MKSIYLAAPWIHRDAARLAAEQLRAAGHKVTSNWLEHPDLLIGDDWELAAEWYPQLQQQAVEDITDILSSDVVLLLALAKSEGKATELGVAYANGMPIILVGERKHNIFYFLPDIYRVDSVQDAIDKLAQVEEIEASQVEDEGRYVN